MAYNFHTFALICLLLAEITIFPSKSDAQSVALAKITSNQEKELPVQLNMAHEPAKAPAAKVGLHNDSKKNGFSNLSPVEVNVQAMPDLKGKKILVYTKNGKGFVHDNIPASIEALQKLGKEHGFQVDTSANSSVFTAENLKQYDALVFSNTNNETIDTEEQKKAFQQYIQHGGGFVAIHSASGSEREWPWYWQVLWW